MKINLSGTRHSQKFYAYYLNLRLIQLESEPRWKRTPVEMEAMKFFSTIFCILIEWTFSHPSFFYLPHILVCFTRCAGSNFRLMLRFRHWFKILLLHWQSLFVSNSFFLSPPLSLFLSSPLSNSKYHLFFSLCYIISVLCSDVELVGDNRSNHFPIPSHLLLVALMLVSLSLFLSLL